MTGSRTLESSQDPLWVRSHIDAINMVVLTTFSDRIAPTIDEFFFFASHGVLYDYGNLGVTREFLPMLAGISNTGSEINHVPDAVGGGFQKQVTIRLHNLADAGSLLAEKLMDHTLENARVEVAQLLVDKFTETPVQDLSALVGDERTIFFRGRVLRAVPIALDEISLLVEVEIPSIADTVILADDSSINDPLDVGARLPIVYGEAKRIPCIGWQVGSYTTLLEAITDSETNVNKEVTDISGFPASGFTVRIDAEEIICDKVDVNTIKIAPGGAGDRAKNGTTAAAHEPTAGITELLTSDPAAIYIAAGHKVDAINSVYINNPFNGELHRITSAFTKDLDDTTTISGKTVASIQFTQAQLQTVLDDLFVAATHTTVGTLGSAGSAASFGTDATYKTPANETIQLFLTSGTNTASVFKAHASAPTVDDSNAVQQIGLDVVCQQANGSTDGYHLWIGAAPQGTRSVKQFRVVWISNYSGHFANDHDVVITYRFYNFAGWDSYISSATDPFTNGVTRIDPPSTWNVPSGKIVSDINRSAAPTASGNDNYLSFYSNNRGADSAGGSEWFELLGSSCYVEVELEPEFVTKIAGATINANSPTGLGALGTAGQGGRSAGFGLRFFADVDGYEAPDGTYDAAINTVMTKPGDIIKHWITVIGGEIMETASYDDTITNLGSDVWAFNALGLGFEWDDILLRMGFEARSNIVPEDEASSRKWRCLQSQTDYAWDTDDVSGEIDVWDDFVDGGRDWRELASRFNFRYDYDPTLGTSEEAFKQVVIATPDKSDVSVTTTAIGDARDLFGEREASPVFLYSILDETTAEEIAGYYVQEGIANGRRVYAIRGVPHHQAYKLRVGDLFELVPAWISTYRPEYTANHMVDQSAPWSANSASLANRNGNTPWVPVHGSGWLESTSDAGPDPVLAFSKDEAPRDLRRMRIRVHVYYPTATYDLLETTTDQAFQFGLSSESDTTPFSSAAGEEWSLWGRSKSELVADAWNIVEQDLSLAPVDQGPGGIADLSNIRSWGLGYYRSGTQVGLLAGWDQLEVFNPRTTVRVIGVEKDWTTHQLTVRCVEVLTS